MGENDLVLASVEWHWAKHTEAESTWEFNPEPVAELWSGGGKTHRKRLYLMRVGTRATLRRITSRGNVWYRDFVIEAPVLIDFLGEVEPLPENLRRLGEELLERRRI